MNYKKNAIYSTVACFSFGVTAAESHTDPNDASHVHSEFHEGFSTVNTENTEFDENPEEDAFEQRLQYEISLIEGTMVSEEELENRVTEAVSNMISEDLLEEQIKVAIASATEGLIDTAEAARIVEEAVRESTSGMVSLTVAQDRQDAAIASATEGLVNAAEVARIVEEKVRESTSDMVPLAVAEERQREAVAAAREEEAARWIEAEESLVEIWRASQPNHANIKEAKIEEVPLSDFLDAEKKYFVFKIRNNAGQLIGKSWWLAGAEAICEELTGNFGSKHKNWSKRNEFGDTAAWCSRMGD